MGVVTASSMERNEPSLAPQWLKGVGHAHSLPFQGNPRYNSNRYQGGERVFERDTTNFRSYSNFGRRSSERDQLVDRSRELDWSRDRKFNDKERFYPGAYNEDKDKERGFGLYRTPPPRPSSGPTENVDKRFSNGFGTANGFGANGFSHRNERLPPKLTLPRTPESRTAESNGSDGSSLSSTPRMSEALLQPLQPQSVVPRERLKPCPAKTTDSSRPAGTVYRPPANSSLSKGSGRLLVLNPIKEGGMLARPAVPHATVNGTSVGKQLVDRRAIPVEALNSNRPKNGLALHEEKKPLVCGQNRSDFFNAIRKKAAANGENRDKGSVASPIEADGNKTSETKQESPKTEGEAVENGTARDSGYTTTRFLAIVRWSEEEEAALLRSLGWEENAEGGALTQAEIDSFIQQHLLWLTSSPKTLNEQSRRLKNAVLDLATEQ